MCGEGQSPASVHCVQTSTLGSGSSEMMTAFVVVIVVVVGTWQVVVDYSYSAAGESAQVWEPRSWTRSWSFDLCGTVELFFSGNTCARGCFPRRRCDQACFLDRQLVPKPRNVPVLDTQI